MNYFEFYCGDYARDTAHLSLAEHGAFLMLLSAYYSTERPLPADHAGLFRIARAMSAAEQKAVRTVADEFFQVAADGLRHNARADLEIIKARKRIETARDNGKRGGRPPKKNPVGNPAGFDQVTQQEPAGKAPHAPPVNQELPPTAGAPAPEPDPIFGVGLDFLRRKGIGDKPARGFLGLLRKEIRDDLTVAELLTEADRQDVSDPCGWLRAAAKQRKSGGSNATSTHGGRLSPAERVARINAEAERRNRGDDDAIDGEYRLAG